MKKSKPRLSMKPSKPRPRLIESTWMYNPRTKAYVKIMANNIEEYDERGFLTRASWTNATIAKAVEAFTEDGWDVSKKPPVGHRSSALGPASVDRGIGPLSLAGKRGKYIHEELSKPEEWDEIRTIVSGSHRVRLGFSQMDPETGTHKKYGIVSILHPLSDPKCTILKQLKHEGLMPKLVGAIYQKDAKRKAGKGKTVATTVEADLEVSIDELVGSLTGESVDQALLTQELTDMKSRADALKKEGDELARSGKALEALTKYRDATELEMAYYQTQLLAGKEDIEKRLQEILPLAMHLKGTWDEIVLDLVSAKVKWVPKHEGQLLQRPRVASFFLIEGPAGRWAFGTSNEAATYMASVLKENKPDYFKTQFPDERIPRVNYRVELPKFLEKHMPEYKVLETFIKTTGQMSRAAELIHAHHPPDIPKEKLVKIKEYPREAVREAVSDMPDTFFPLDELEEVDVE